jgi:glutathione S-transferase
MNALNSPLLIIGSKNYSSWSLRPWIFLRKVGFAFSERTIHFDGAHYQEEIAAVSPSKRVPLLVTGGNTIWDSLAICEYAADATGRGLPANALAKGVARSVAAEMHAGFSALREQCPMNARARGHRVAATPELSEDVARIDQLWERCRREFGAGGPWLFGDFCVADAMFAPVVLRFQTYGLPLGGVAQGYLTHFLADPTLAEYQAAAAGEAHPLDFVDIVGKL